MIWLLLLLPLWACAQNPAQSELNGKRLRQQVRLAKAFAKQQQNCRSDVAFFVDFKAPSNQYRFFVCELFSGRLLDSGLVAHGQGCEIQGQKDLQFSNIPNSYQSSLGAYRIGQFYYGNFGPAYRLHGLQASNNAALERAIVLHAHDCIPQAPTLTPICLSQGCPTVSHNFLQILKKYIDKKPNSATGSWVLLWTYY